MKTLTEIYNDPVPHGDKGTVHSYISHYETLLAPYRQLPGNILEIGVFKGESLRMWEKYFTIATVYGIDLCDRPLNLADLRPMVAEGTHKILFLDASNHEQVEQHFHGMFFNAIIEDASHSIEQQLAIYANFRDKLVHSGIYVIEDIEKIDRDRNLLLKIDPERHVEVLDLRKFKQRFDDVLVVIGSPA